MAAKAPFAWYGGKATLAKWVIGHFPDHQVYVEPFGGAASVLVAKPPSPVEIYNDLDERLVNFFRVLQEPQSFTVLQRLLELTPYSRSEWKYRQNETKWENDMRSAADFFIHCRMARGGFGGTTISSTLFAVSTRVRRGMCENVSKYLSAIEGLPELVERFRSVAIEGLPAEEIIQRYDGSDTLFYCDPPYLPETRSESTRKVYAQEMSRRDHWTLLCCLLEVTGKVVISGYLHKMYDDMLDGWVRITKKTHTKINSKRSPRTEVLWMNFTPPASGDTGD